MPRPRKNIVASSCPVQDCTDDEFANRVESLERAVMLLASYIVERDQIKRFSKDSWMRSVARCADAEPW